MVYTRTIVVSACALGLLSVFAAPIFPQTRELQRRIVLGKFLSEPEAGNYIVRGDALDAREEYDARDFDDIFENDARDLDGMFEYDARDFEDMSENDARDLDEMLEYDARDFDENDARDLDEMLEYDARDFEDDLEYDARDYDLEEPLERDVEGPVLEQRSWKSFKKGLGKAFRWATSNLLR